MSVLSGTQLNLLSCLNADNGIAQVEDQEPIADYIWFISKDSDITPELYQYVNDLFIHNLLILDLETYGYKIPENGEYKKKLTSIKQKQKKGTTTGLQEMAISPKYGDIRLLQLAALCSEKVLVVDFKTIWDRPQLSDNYNKFINYLIEKLKEFAKRKGVLVGHNIGFDLGFLRSKYGIKLWKVYDTMIMSQLLSAGILTYKHGLKDCCSRYLGIEVDKTEQSADNSLPLRNAQINYAASDVANTGELFSVLRNEIKIARLEAVTEIEAKFTPALVEINYWGMPVDIQELDRQIKWYLAKLMEIDKEFVAMFPFMNIRSSDHIASIIDEINQKLSSTKQQEIDELYQESLDDEPNNLNKYQKEYLRQQAALEVLANASEDEVNAAIFDIKKEENQFKDIKTQKVGSSKSDLALLNDYRVVQLVVDFRTISIFANYCQQVRQELVWIENIPRVSGTIRQLTRKGQGRTCSGNKKAPVKCQGVNIQNPPSKKSINRRLQDYGCPRVRDIFGAKQTKFASAMELELMTKYKLFSLAWLMDFRIVDVDLPAAHLAIATYMSGETDVAEGIDRHAITMKCVFDSIDSYKEYRHLSVKEITDINNNSNHPLFKKFKKIRSMCKNVVYSGLNFGSAPTLQTTIKTNSNEEVPLPVCEAMTNAFPVILPKIAQLRETLWKKANDNKICVDGYWYGTFQDDYSPYATPGYRRRIYSRCKVNKYNQHYVPKGDIANCWLATESSSVKWGIATIYQENVFTDKFDLRLSSICHDEVVLFCRKFQDIEVAKLTQDSMRQGLEKFTGNKIPYPDLMVNPRKLISVGWEH